MADIYDVDVGGTKYNFRDDAKTPVYGKGVNLLDNWYFVGGGQFPINQRGETSYSGAGYGIDRWKSEDSGDVLTVTINSNGTITLENPSSTTVDQAWYTQYLSTIIQAGEKITYSVLVTSFSGVVSVYTNDIGFLVTKNGINYLTYTATTDVNMFRIVLLPGSSITLKAVKLELGDTQTLAHQENGTWVLNDPPPNYQQELAKCQRYQVVLNYLQHQTVGICGIANTWLTLQIPLSLPLRLTYLTDATIIVGSLHQSNAFGTELPSPTSITCEGCSLQIGFPYTGNAGGGYVAAKTDVKILIDANL